MTRGEFLRGCNDLVEHEPLDQLAEQDEKLGELMRRVVDRARTILEAEPCPPSGEPAPCEDCNQTLCECDELQELAAQDAAERMPTFEGVEVSIELEPEDQ